LNIFFKISSLDLNFHIIELTLLKMKLS